MGDRDLERRRELRSGSRRESRRGKEHHIAERFGDILLRWGTAGHALRQTGMSVTRAQRTIIARNEHFRVRPEAVIGASIRPACDALLAFDVRRLDDRRPARNLALHQDSELLLAAFRVFRNFQAEVDQAFAHGLVVERLVERLAALRSRCCFVAQLIHDCLRI
jgi:hypothetical protein